MSLEPSDASPRVSSRILSSGPNGLWMGGGCDWMRLCCMYVHTCSYVRVSVWGMGVKVVLGDYCNFIILTGI